MQAETFDAALLTPTARRIRSVLVYVDHPRLRIGWVQQRLTKESLGCCGIAFGREQEIDGLPCGIDGSVQVPVLPFDTDVGLIDAVASIAVSGERGSACPVPARRFGPSARCNWGG